MCDRDIVVGTISDISEDIQLNRLKWLLLLYLSFDSVLLSMLDPDLVVLRL